jgi:hypothetical protein
MMRQEFQSIMDAPHDGWCSSQDWRTQLRSEMTFAEAGRKEVEMVEELITLVLSEFSGREAEV